MLKFFHRKIWWGRKKCLTLHSQTRNKHRLQRELKKNGAVVQPVRIQACHAWGRGFESRPHRRGERKSSIVSIYTSCCSFSFVQAIHTDIPALPVQCARRTNLLPTLRRTTAGTPPSTSTSKGTPSPPCSPIKKKRLLQTIIPE